MGELPHLTILDLSDTEYMLPGNRACAGCGLAIAYRYVIKALEGKAIIAVPAGCLTVLMGMYPLTSVSVPSVNTPFPGTAAVTSGLAAGLKALGREEITAVGFAGDGGTLDIGIQGLSGAAERGDNLIYVCYDNEAYMNTGGQRSGSTPLGAITSTTPVKGKEQHQKDIDAIMAAHHIPYLATASAAYPLDIFHKVRKAKEKKGTRFIHIAAPCPPGWLYPSQDTIKIGKLAVETGIFVLYEIEKGSFRLTGESEKIARTGKLKPVKDFVESQGRFSKLTRVQIEELQKWVNLRWAEFQHRTTPQSSA